MYIKGIIIYQNNKYIYKYKMLLKILFVIRIINNRKK